MADGEPWRIAVNVKSSDKSGRGPDRSIVLYRDTRDTRDTYTRALANAISTIIQNTNNSAGLVFARFSRWPQRYYSPVRAILALNSPCSVDPLVY